MNHKCPVTTTWSLWQMLLLIPVSDMSGPGDVCGRTNQTDPPSSSSCTHCFGSGAPWLILRPLQSSWRYPYGSGVWHI